MDPRTQDPVLVLYSSGCWPFDKKRCFIGTVRAFIIFMSLEPTQRSGLVPVTLPWKLGHSDLSGDRSFLLHCLKNIIPPKISLL